MKLAFETDAGSATRARLGLVVLAADEALEPEFRDFTALDGVVVHHSRIESDPEVTLETLKAMEARITTSAALLPAAAPFDVVGYACTSGASVIGPERVAALVRAARPEARVSDPMVATRAALRALSVRRIAFLTPYLPQVTAAVRAALEADGIEIVEVGAFEQSTEAIVARITPASILEAVVTLARRASGAEAVFISCTNLRAAPVIPATEAALGIPVVSSNQALAWHMLRLAGIAEPLENCGRLFTRALAAP